MTQRPPLDELSYDNGTCDVPLIGCTLGYYFDKICLSQPDSDAIVDCSNQLRWSYLQLQQQAESFACGLLKAGVKTGDRIGIWSTNNAFWIATQIAAAQTGAILVNINPSYKVEELHYVLNNSGVSILVVVPTYRSSNYLEMLATLKPQLFGQADAPLDSDRLPALKKVIVISDQTPAFNLERFADLQIENDEFLQNELIARKKKIQFDDAINIQYTSGTTGHPKGVTLSHHNLLNNGWLAAKAMNLESTSRFCVPMPFYHCGGMISSALATLTAGGAIIIPSPFFDEAAVLTAVEKEKCTHLSGVPTMFISELQFPEFKTFDLTSLTGGFMAGAPCPVKLMVDVAHKMHMTNIVILYGLTEAAPLMTSTTVRDSLKIRTTTVGKVIPGIELKVIDPNTGAVLPRGMQGEICSRGHGVMLGYWNNEEATRAAIDQAGWLHSGDLGVMNEEGYINITGRKKDMIIRGGENVYPREIEEVLHEHPSVMQAQVFGVPDHLLGEEIAVWLMLKSDTTDDADSVIEWLGQRIAHYKIPRYARVVEGFPMTVTGKIQKFMMRRTMIEALNLQEANAVQTA